MEIKKIEFVNIREIWRHEALDFTNWLSENIDFLEDSIGFPISVIETERQIGSFNVDIFGEDEQGNSVIIENQLEKTDHQHLGQILTYSVGAAAKTIIWISPEPREEHIEVVEWLNEVTPADMRWFLFKLEGVRTGDSIVSPLFTKVVAPSTEIKALGAEKKELADRHIKRLEFWEQLLPVLNSKTNIYKNVSPSKDNWLAGRTGTSGINFHIIIRMESAAVQLVIEKSRGSELNNKIFDYIYSHKEDIEEKLGKVIIWNRMDNKVSSRIRYDIDKCGLKDITTWKEGHEIISNEFVKWEKVFIPYIRKISDMNFN